jgi:2'-5' RNA ligase
MAKDRLKSPRIRLFVALDLPDEVLDRVVAWRDAVFERRRDLRMLDRYSLHVTLAFLGYQAERDVERIRELAFAEGSEPFELRPLDVVEVPPRRPRLYALYLEDRDERLRSWQGRLAGRLAEAKLYEPEKRPFWTHVTVARFKQTERHGVGGGSRGGRGGRGRGGGAPTGPLVAPPELPEELQAPFEARRITLYRSTLRPQGALYEPLARAELTGTAPSQSTRKSG